MESSDDCVRDADVVFVLLPALLLLLPDECGLLCDDDGDDDDDSCCCLGLVEVISRAFSPLRAPTFTCSSCFPL